MTAEAMNYIEPSKAVLSPLAYTQDRCATKDDVYDEKPSQRFKLGNRSPTSQGRMREDENAVLQEENSLESSLGSTKMPSVFQFESTYSRFNRSIASSHQSRSRRRSYARGGEMMTLVWQLWQLGYPMSTFRGSLRARFCFGHNHQVHGMHGNECVSLAAEGCNH
eukprot:751314-Hanusia_phi.AAC.4